MLHFISDREDWCNVYCLDVDLAGWTTVAAGDRGVIKCVLPVDADCARAPCTETKRNFHNEKQEPTFQRKAAHFSVELSGNWNFSQIHGRL